MVFESDSFLKAQPRIGMSISQGVPITLGAAIASRAKPTTTNSPSLRCTVEVSLRLRSVGPTSSTSPASGGASAVTSTSSSRRTPPASPTVGFTRRSMPTSWRSTVLLVWNEWSRSAPVFETGIGMLLPEKISCSSPASMRSCGRISVCEWTSASFPVTTVLVRGTISEVGLPIESMNGITSGARVKRSRVRRPGAGARLRAGRRRSD